MLVTYVHIMRARACVKIRWQRFVKNGRDDICFDHGVNFEHEDE